MNKKNLKNALLKNFNYYIPPWKYAADSDLTGRQNSKGIEAGHEVLRLNYIIVQRTHGDCHTHALHVLHKRT